MSDDTYLIVAIMLPCILGLIIAIYFLNLYAGLVIYRRINKLQRSNTNDARSKVARLLKLEDSGKAFVWGRYTYLGKKVLYSVIGRVNAVVGWTYLFVGRATNKAGTEPLKVFGSSTEGSRADVEAGAARKDVEIYGK